MFVISEGKEKYPAIFVTWYGARAYCAWASEVSGKKYRLPAEAEWEYAARERGKKVRFGNGKDIIDPKEVNFAASGAKKYQTEYAVAGEYRERTVPVGSFSPNALGLYNMTGNVSEWCSDLYQSDFYKRSPSQNPLNTIGASYRVIRGGGWNFYPYHCRATKRYYSNAYEEGYNTGFRVVVEP